MRTRLASLLIGLPAVAAAILMAWAVLTMAVPDTAPAAPQCTQEDSPGPCRWDASTQGNGTGRSFYRDAQGRVWYDEDAVKAYNPSRFTDG